MTEKKNSSLEGNIGLKSFRFGLFAGLALGSITLFTSKAFYVNDPDSTDPFMYAAVAGLIGFFLVLFVSFFVLWNKAHNQRPSTRGGGFRSKLDQKNRRPSSKMS